MNAKILDIQSHTLDARERLGGELEGDGLISVAVENGKGQIRRVRALPNGDSEFDALSDWMSIDDIIPALDRLEV